MEKIDWERERENAIKLGMIMDIYIDRSLNYIERMNPFIAMVEKLPHEKKLPIDIDISSMKGHVHSSINTWLETFDEVLKSGKSLPIDLIGRAAEIAKALREKKGEKTEGT